MAAAAAAAAILILFNWLIILGLRPPEGPKGFIIIGLPWKKSNLFISILFFVSMGETYALEKFGISQNKIPISNLKYD